MAPTLERGDAWDGVIDVYDANNRRFPLWERADTIRDKEGKMLYGFGLMHDMTKERQEEKALQESETRSDLRVLICSDYASDVPV